MANETAIGAITSPLVGGINFKLFGIVFLACAVLIGFFFLIKKIKDAKAYDVLVEVVPRWSLTKGYFVKKQTVEPTGFAKMMGAKARIIKTKVPIQKFQTYFVSGAYMFNKKNGIYEVKLKDGAKTIVSGIPYRFFKPISHGKFTRHLKLFRDGPADYKPCDILFEGDTEIRNIYDSEGTYVALKTGEEIEARFKKSNELLKWLPIIIVIIMAIVFIIFAYINAKANKDYATALSNVANAMREVAKSLAMAGK